VATKSIPHLGVTIIMAITIKAAALDYGTLFNLPDSQGNSSYTFRQEVPDNDLAATQATVGWVDSAGNDVLCFTLGQKYYIYALNTVSAATSSNGSGSSDNSGNSFTTSTTITSTRSYLNLNTQTPATTNSIVPGFPSLVVASSLASTVTIWVFRSVSSNIYTFDVFNNNVSESVGVTLSMIFPEGSNYECGAGEVQGGLSTGLIVAIVLAGLFLLIIVIVSIVVSKKSSKAISFDTSSSSLSSLGLPYYPLPPIASLTSPVVAGAAVSVPVTSTATAAVNLF